MDAPTNAAYCPASIARHRTGIRGQITRVKRLRLSHNYHDAVLRAVEVGDRRLSLVIDLDPHWNKRVAEQCHLFFEGVRNMGEVLGQLGQSTDPCSFDVGAEIVGIVRDDDGRIVLDVMGVGPLYIDCKSVRET